MGASAATRRLGHGIVPRHLGFEDVLEELRIKRGVDAEELIEETFVNRIVRANLGGELGHAVPA